METLLKKQNAASAFNPELTLPNAHSVPPTSIKSRYPAPRSSIFLWFRRFSAGQRPLKVPSAYRENHYFAPGGIVVWLSDFYAGFEKKGVFHALQGRFIL
jgi:hypothetical protein